MTGVLRKGLMSLKEEETGEASFPLSFTKTRPREDIRRHSSASQGEGLSPRAKSADLRLLSLQNYEKEMSPVHATLSRVFCCRHLS